jgi:hypothetical protein
VIDYVTPITTTLYALSSAVIGGLLVHYLSIKRDRASKRRELVVMKKMELWKAIDAQNGLAEDTLGNQKPEISGWENIVRDIQLLGSNNQIELVHEIIKGIHNKVEVSFNPLLNSLQSELRRELGMEAANRGYFWFRVERKVTASTENKK